MRKITRLFIFEKPVFNRFPKLRLTTSKYCYVFPTGNGTSKSVAELKYNSSYSKPKEDVYDATFYMITYSYTVFFLWFRLHIEFYQNKMSEGMYSKFDKNKTSGKTVTDYFKL